MIAFLADTPLPIVRPTIYSRCLHRAAQSVGGLRALSKMLRVPKSDLLRWMTGVELPPRAVFLAAVDIVVATDSAPNAPRERRRSARAAIT